MAKREYIKVSKYYYIVLGLMFLAGVVFIIFQEIIYTRNYRSAEYQTEIKPVIIKGTEGWGYLKSSRVYSRSVIFYKKDGFVDDAILVSAGCAHEVLSKFGIKKQTLTSNGYEPRFYLYDLKYPFQLSKKANSDTLIVNKESCLLKFLILVDDEP